MGLRGWKVSGLLPPRRELNARPETTNLPSAKPTAGFAGFGSPVYQKFFYGNLYKNFPKSAFETQQTQQACLPP
jgi:hypothetical protein